MKITDKQRVELGLLAHMMLGVLEQGVDNPEHQDAKNARQLLLLAAAEPLLDLDKSTRDKLIRRTGRVHDVITAEYRKANMPVACIGLITFYITKSLLECEYLILGPESFMQKALGYMLPALEPAAQIKDLDAQAQEAAPKVMEHLQRLGYFKSASYVG